MPMFQNSQNTDTRGGTFNDVGRDQFNMIVHGPVINNTTNNADPLALLNPVPDAVYNNVGAGFGCMAGTRQEVIGQIDSWIDGSSDQPICWLYGAAGSGKSAISKTVAEQCAERNRLGGSFFFLRAAGLRSRITNFIPTLAYHLAFSVPATRPYIESILQREHHIVHRSLEYQFRILIIGPIQSLDTPILPMVIIVDALDECDDQEIIADFIDIVTRALRNQPLPLRFLFTSRVENHIQRKFLTSPVLEATYCLALQQFNADKDILTYFRSCFHIIYQENCRLMGKISLPWPDQAVLDKLVRKSDGSFIFAFTLVNFVNDGSDLPHRKLAAALKSHVGLDPLYSQVLRSDRRSPHFLRIFETIMTIGKHLSVADVAYLLRVEAGDVILALQGVRSILYIPENDELPIRPFHTSLRDFLTTRDRSKDLFIEPFIRRLSIASDCLAVMVVHKNDDFFGHEGLEFACRAWCRHLLFAIQRQAGDTSKFLPGDFHTFMMELTNFASQSFDLWVNSIIIQCLISQTLDTFNSVVSVFEKLHQCPPNMLATIKKIKDFFESDEKRFLTDNNLGAHGGGGGYYYYYGVHRHLIRYIKPNELVNMIQEWRKTQPVTTWSRFQCA